MDEKTLEFAQSKEEITKQEREDKQGFKSVFFTPGSSLKEHSFLRVDTGRKPSAISPDAVTGKRFGSL